MLGSQEESVRLSMRARQLRPSSGFPAYDRRLEITVPGFDHLWVKTEVQTVSRLEEATGTISSATHERVIAMLVKYVVDCR